MTKCYEIEAGKKQYNRPTAKLMMDAK